METLTSYQRYYQRNREAITARLRNTYNPNAKHQYYEEHKDHIKEKMKEIYQRNKEAKNKQALETALTSADEAKRAILKKVIDSEAYKTMGAKSIQTLVAV